MTPEDRENYARVEEITREIHAHLVLTYREVGKNHVETWAVTNALIKNAVSLIVIGTHEDQQEELIDRMTARIKQALPAMRAKANAARKRS